jgi:peptidyl-prolyl cis-trans isomerase D
MIMRLMRKYFGYWVFAFLLVTLSIGLVSGGLSISGNQDAIAVVGGESIKYDHYATLLRNAEEGERSRRGRELSEKDLAKLRRDVLDQLVNESLALQGLDDLSIHMSVDEVQQTLMSMPLFLNEQGQYDPKKYENYLMQQAQRGQSYEMTEASIHRSLTLNKAQTFWRNSAKVSPAEVEQGLKQLHRKAKAKVAVWNYKALQAVQKPTDDELRTYYSQNRSRWEKPDQVKARHILIKADALLGTATAKAKADELYKKAKAGADFAKLAKENSQDEGSAAKGGDLGFFSRGDMVPEFEAKAFELKSGEIGEPVLSKFGWHIIKTESKKPGFSPTYENSKDKVKDGLSEEMARTQARQEASLAAASLSEGQDLAAACKGLKAELKETGWFKLDEKALLSGLSNTAQLANNLLSLEKGQSLSGPLSLEKGVVIGTLIDEQPGELTKDASKLAERRGEVLRRLHSEKAAALYEGWLNSLRADAKIEDRFEFFYGGKK